MAKKKASRGNESAKLWASHLYILAEKAAASPAFKKLLLSKPAEALKSIGVVAAKGAKLKVVAPRAKEAVFVLPPSRGTIDYQGVDLKDADLKSGDFKPARLMDDFDIRRKTDARVGNSDGKDPGQRDNDYSGDDHTSDHKS